VTTLCHAGGSAVDAIKASRRRASFRGSACQDLHWPINPAKHTDSGWFALGRPHVLWIQPVLSAPASEHRLRREDCMIALPRSFSAARLARGRFAKLKGIKYVWRQQLSKATPAWARPLLWRGDTLVLDHGVFRVAYLNQHRLGVHAWRSSQPAPHNIDGFARRGCAPSSTFVASATAAASCWRR